jgi:hypothetical protein
MKKPTKTILMKKADIEFSNYWRNKIGQCEKCGRKNLKLELAHFKSRDYRCIRFARDNTFVLCTACHFYFHKNPDNFKEFFIEKRGFAILKWINLKIQKLKPLTIGFYKMQYDLYKEMNKKV